MPSRWNLTRLPSEADALGVLAELRGRRWLSRGQPAQFGGLAPSIDRRPRKRLQRAEKLALERRSIELFRSTARVFAGSAEQDAQHDDVVALMLLRHYGVPTRLLDWTLSPWVAAYFACEEDKGDGAIWTFDYRHYERVGAEQWKRWPETTTDSSGDRERFDAKLTAFQVAEPPDWFVCAFYGRGFPRQDAQQSAYSMTARLGRDHAEAIAGLLGEGHRPQRHVVPSNLKPRLRRVLREKYGIWRGSLFPDAAGAPCTAGAVFPRR